MLGENPMKSNGRKGIKHIWQKTGGGVKKEDTFSNLLLRATDISIGTDGTFLMLQGNLTLFVSRIFLFLYQIPFSLSFIK